MFERSPPGFDKRVGERDVGLGEKPSEESRIDQLTNGTVEFLDAALDGIPMREAGAVFAFEKIAGTWVEQGQLSPDPADLGWEDWYGFRLALDGEWAVVGAPGPAGHWRAGSTHVFHFDGTSWIRTQKLLSSNTSVDDGFGVSVSISGDWILVGALGLGPHAVYAFKRVGNQWVQTQQLSGQTGFSLSVAGLVAAVGGFQHADVFRLDAGRWLLEASLQGADIASGDGFGSVVSLRGDMLAVGAPGDDEGSLTNSGSVYLFQQVGGLWQEMRKLRAPDASADDGYGRALSLGASDLALGVPSRDPGGVSNAGAVYVFTGRRADCNCNLVSGQCEIDDGSAVDCDGSGILDECEDLLTGDCICDGGITIEDFSPLQQCLTGPVVEKNRATMLA